MSYETQVAALTYPQVARKVPNKIARTQAQFMGLFNGLAAGDWLAVEGVTFTGEVALHKTLAAYAKVSFDSACKFLGVSAQANLPAVWIKQGSSYLQLVFDGCPVSNRFGGSGILQHASHHIVIDGYLIHGTGQHGVAALPIGGDIHDCFYRGEVYDIGQNHAYDPHTAKGSGLHCFLAGDTSQGKFRSNRVAVYGHDCTYSGGSVLEIGDAGAAYPSASNDIWVKGHRMLYEAPSSSTGGNGVNAWGHLLSCTFHCVEVGEMMGKAVDCDPYAPFTGCVVREGVATGCCLNPAVKGQSPWDIRGGIVYRNVSTA